MPAHVSCHTLHAGAYKYCCARFLSDLTATKSREGCRKVRCRFPNTNTRQGVRNRISYSIPCLSTLLRALLIFRLPSAFEAGLLRARPRFCDIRDVQRQQNGQGQVWKRPVPKGIPLPKENPNTCRFRLPFQGHGIPRCRVPKRRYHSLCP